MRQSLPIISSLLVLVLVAGCGDDGASPQLEEGLLGRVTDFSGAPVADAAIGLIFEADLPDVFAKPQTGIRFVVPDSSWVTIIILDAAENPVRTLVDETLAGGSHTIIWDATDDEGSRVPNGLYWYVLQIEGVEVDRNPLFLIDPSPTTLPERANAVTDTAGYFRIPRALVPAGVVIPVTDELGGLLGDYPISRTVTVEVGRMNNGNLAYSWQVITLPESWERYEVEISVPLIKPRD